MTASREAIAPVGSGWAGSDLAADPDRWKLEVTREVAEELVALSDGLDVTTPVAGPLDLSPEATDLVAQVRHRLADDPGLVLLTGFPIDVPARAAYWLFGSQIGRPVSQTVHGETIIEVADKGVDINDPHQRGHRSASALPFHADRTDIIGLLCIRPAEEGGESKVVSSKYLHDSMLLERPDLLEVLYGLVPNDQRGEEREGASAWIPLPVFSQAGGDFAARYVRRFIEGSQRHADAPRLTSAQLEAMDLLDEIIHRPGTALDMSLEPGDLQLINNFHTLHSRAAFTDSVGEGVGRMLLRLWLTFDDSPELPVEYGPLYGRTGHGAYRGGVWPTSGQGGAA